MTHVSVIAVLSYLILLVLVAGEEDEPQYVKQMKDMMFDSKYARECEVCKYIVTELEARLKGTGKSQEVPETGYGLEPAKKYQQSEERLLDSLAGICDGIVVYNIQKAIKDSSLFGNELSPAFKMLYDLLDEDLKVSLGLPIELYGKPSAESNDLKSQCENLLGKHESHIKDWYFNHQDVPLKQFLCIDRALDKGDTGCLDEILTPEPEKKGKDETSAKNKSEKLSADKKEETSEAKNRDSTEKVQNAKTEL